MSKKLILVAILLCTLIPFAANATITRVIGLGGEATNYIVKDAYNPVIWPQLIQDYPNLAGAEFYTPGDNYFEKAYINYNFGEDRGVLQFSLDRNTGIRSQFGLGTIGQSGMYEYTSVLALADPLAARMAGKFNAIYGRKFGDMKAGLQFTLAERSEEQKNGANTDKTGNMLFGLNLGLSALEDKLDMSLGYEMVSFSTEVGGQTVRDNDGSMGLQVAARYWYDYSTKAALVPNFRFLTLTDAWTSSLNNTTNGESEAITDIKLGVGHNWTPVDNALAIFELGVDLRSVKMENTTSGTTASVTNTGNYFPYWRAGFETAIFGWLNGRIGAERGWIAESSDQTNVEPGSSYSDTYTYLGATAHWNRLIMDLLVTPDFVTNGPNFVSGAVTPLFTRVLLKYDFNQ